MELDIYKLLTAAQKKELTAAFMTKALEHINKIEVIAESIDISSVINRELSEAFSDQYVVNEDDMEKISKAVAAKMIKAIKVI